MSEVGKTKCISCNGILKKQIIGLNVMAYCPKCGTITTTKTYDELHAPLSIMLHH